MAKFDFITPARSVMLSLIVDDGVADRGHRVAIYNPRFRVVGIASGAHSEYGPHTPSRDSSIARSAVLGCSASPSRQCPQTPLHIAFAAPAPQACVASP